MGNDDIIIDPWGSAQSTDYDRIIQQFGLSPLSGETLTSPSKLHRRGIVFAHRDLDVIQEAQRKGDPFGVLTGLMPSGQMHLGHSMVVEQVKWFQKQGGDVTIAVADLESQATRGVSLEKGREVALNEYIAHYAALGLDPERTNVYFQSTRPVVQRLGFQLGKRTNLNEFESIYGFGGETNLAHVQAPLVQVGDILHPQTEEYGGLRPIVVPVGVDQDPHLRLTRGLASKTNWFNIKDSSSKGMVLHNSTLHDLTGCSTLMNWIADGHACIVEMKRMMQRTTEFNQALNTLHAFVEGDAQGQIIRITDTRLMLLPQGCRGLRGTEMEGFTATQGDFSEV
jgi:hypothetical protein